MAAEVTATFGRRLSPLNLVVKELTGDMQLTRSEIEETQVLSLFVSLFKLVFLSCTFFNLVNCTYLCITQMIVTTPEKWDVITRKSSDMALSMLVKLIIIDEVHLLNDDRGSVIETLVARTLRQVSFGEKNRSPSIRLL